MAAARDPTRNAVAAARASRRAAPIAAAGCALVTGVLLLGNPFAAPPPPAPRVPQPEIRMGTAELSLPEPAALPAPPAPAPPTPAAVEAAPAPPAFVVPPAPAATIRAATRPVPKARQMGGGKRATIIVETLPAKPIIPPFVPKQPTGAAPQPRPTLPLDTEIGKTSTIAPATPSPAPKAAAAGLLRDG